MDLEESRKILSLSISKHLTFPIFHYQMFQAKLFSVTPETYFPVVS